MTEDVKLQGFDELDRLLHTLPDKVAKKILRQSVVEGAKVIANEADTQVRSRVHIVHGGKTTNIKTSQHYSEVSCLIMPSKKKWYLKFFETGVVLSSKTYQSLKHTAKIKARELSRKAGHWRIAPRPWLRPAINMSGEKAIQKMGEDLGMKIEIEMRAEAGSLK